MSHGQDRRGPSDCFPVADSCRASGASTVNRPSGKDLARIHSRKVGAATGPWEGRRITNGWHIPAIGRLYPGRDRSQ